MGFPHEQLAEDIQDHVNICFWVGILLKLNEADYNCLIRTDGMIQFIGLE